MKRTLHIFSLMCLIAILFSCDKTCRVGIGEYISRTLVLDSINSIEVGLSSNIVLKRDSIQKVEIRAQQNVIEDLNTEVANEFWAIDQLGTCLEIDRPVELNLALEHLRAIIINGNTDLVFANAFDSLKRLEIASNASGRVVPKGSSTELMVTINNAGSVEGLGFYTEDAVVIINGSGNLHVNVSKTLNAEISGSGNVYYRGNPTLILSRTGSGQAIKL